MAEERLTVRVNVDLLVFGIFVVVKTRAIRHVSILEAQTHRVLSSRFEELGRHDDSVFLKAHAFGGSLDPVDVDV